MNTRSIVLGISIITTLALAAGCLEPGADATAWTDPQGPREPYRYRLPDGSIAVGTGVRIGDRLLISGDVLIPADRALSADDGGKGGPSNAAVSGNIWPRKTIVYQFTDGVAPATRASVLSAAQAWAPAGFSFRPRTTEAVFLEITTQATEFNFVCAADIGYTFGVQSRYHAAPNCRVRDFVHEWGHVLGLFHEHERTDRDQFVEILDPDPRLNATIAGRGGVNWGGYDFGSIMHYDAFARNLDGSLGAVIIRARDGRPDNSFGWNEAPSGQDLWALQSLYWSELPCGGSTGRVCP